MTIVEWQFNELQKIEKALANKIIDGMEFIKMKYEILDKAKEMEEEQREKDFVEGYKTRANLSNITYDEASELYAKALFNKKFKSE